MVFNIILTDPPRLALIEWVGMQYKGYAVGDLTIKILFSFFVVLLVIGINSLSINNSITMFGNAIAVGFFFWFSCFDGPV